MSAAAAAPPLAVEALANGIPPRPSHALTGSQFAESLATLDAPRREVAIQREILGGNVPTFLRHLVPVELSYTPTAGRSLSATIFVMPDYLAIGSDTDFLRIPMNLETASAVADRLGFVLPTRKMVDMIYTQSAFHFAPEPLPAGPRMTSTDYYRTHNALIEQQARDRGIPAGVLVSGDKKDVVVSNRLLSMPGRIAIYGWHRLSGAPIQPLSTVHGACYADYSHGIRLISDMAIVDGVARPVRDILAQSVTAGILSDEGVISAALGASLQHGRSHCAPGN